MCGKVHSNSIHCSDWLCAISFTPTPFIALICMAICHRVHFIGVCYGVLNIRITPSLFDVECFVAVCHKVHSILIHCSDSYGYLPQGLLHKCLQWGTRRKDYPVVFAVGFFVAVCRMVYSIHCSYSLAICHGSAS